MSETDAKTRLASYLKSLLRERQRYVEESEQQLKTLPESLKREHPEGGLPVALGIAAATTALADNIKASRAIVEVLPGLAQFCKSEATNLRGFGDQVKAVFDDLLFNLE